MKKVYVQIADDNTVFLDRFDGSERFALYIGIDEVYGGWLLETAGAPLTLNDYEDADTEHEINAINRIIESDNTPWEMCDADDIESVRSTLRGWGII